MNSWYVCIGGDFAVSKSSLGDYYTDTTDARDTVLVNYVEDNCSRYSERDYSRELEARNMQHKVALSSHRHIIKFVENKTQMENCPLNHDYVKGTEDI